VAVTPISLYPGDVPEAGPRGLHQPGEAPQLLRAQHEGAAVAPPGRYSKCRTSQGLCLFCFLKILIA
jgi:hypothetical protein